MDWKSKRVRAILETALNEDKCSSDVTTSMTIDPKLRGTATIAARQPCVLAGVGAIPVFLELFAAQRVNAGAPPVGRFEVISHPEIFDGVKVKRGQTIAVIRGNAAALLSTERVILNLLQRMSGIATLTSEFVEAVAGTSMRVLDTRKTMPGLRMLEKYAVCCGGGVNHRQDLEDGILIRGSHAALGGGLRKAVGNAVKFSRGKQVVQVQVRTAEELDEAMDAGAGAYLLDSMTPAAVKKSVKVVRERMPNATVGISGHLALTDVKAYAASGADFLTVAEPTQGSHAADLVMRIVADVS